MFADYVKMAAKAVALGLGVVIIINFLTQFNVAVPNMDFVLSYINKAYSIGSHYIPYFSVLWGLGTTLLTLQITLFGVRLALIGTRWVLKVNE